MTKATILLILLVVSLVLANATPTLEAFARQPPSQVEGTQPYPQEPSRELARPSSDGEPTKVEVGIYVIDVDLVNSAEQNFSASIYYEARWNSPALKHTGPSPLIRESTAIWTPRLTVVNQQQAWRSFPAAAEISPDGEVTYRQKVWGWFSQPLNLRNFPLDRQTLKIHVIAVGVLESEISLIPLAKEHGRTSGISERFSLPDFHVVSWRAQPTPYVPYDGQVGVAGFLMEVDLQRRSAYYFWKIVFPFCLIVFISWIPRWIDHTQVSTNIGISTTSFLTLVAYIFAVSYLLPRISYFTRLDLFILLSTIMVFMGVLQTAMTAVLLKSQEATLAIVDWWSRIIYPVALLAILGISFVL